MKDLVPIAYNLVLELRTTLLRHLDQMHAPRSLGRRVDEVTLSASISISLAGHRMQLEHHVRHARGRLDLLLEILAKLRADYGLSPLMHRWALSTIEKIQRELLDFDPKKVMPLMAPIARPPPPLIN
jgi:hypothetical protein